MAGAPQEQLPDLAAAVDDKIKEKQGERELGYDEETEILEALVAGTGEPDLDEMAERAKVYEAKIEEAKEKKEPPNPPAVSSSDGKEMTARERSKIKAGLVPSKEKSTPSSEKKKKGKGNKMKMALAMAQTATTTPPIKPIGEPEINVPSAGEPASPSAPLIEDATPTVSQQQEVVNDGETEEDLWGDDPANRTPRTGDEAFPVPLPPPSVSDNYSRLSTAASLHEEMSAELHEMAGTLRTVLANIAETNNKIATVERTVHKLEEDKSHYMSSILDRIREVERTLGNKKPETTPASSVAALTTTSPVAEVSTGSPSASTVDVAALLAARKARRNK